MNRPHKKIQDLQYSLETIIAELRSDMEHKISDLTVTIKSQQEKIDDLIDQLHSIESIGCRRGGPF